MRDPGQLFIANISECDFRPHARSTEGCTAAKVRCVSSNILFIQSNNFLKPRTIGITLIDNGAGRVFIKRIKPNSYAARFQQSTGALQVGDHIESINGESMVGKKHYQVASVLRGIAVGEKYVYQSGIFG